MNVIADQVVYVSRRGNDAASGRSQDEPRATILAGLQAAVALNPSATNRVAIVVLDSGEYAESLALTTPYLVLHAPLATLRGTLEVGDHTTAEVGRILPTTTTAITKYATGTGLSIVRAEYVVGSCENNAVGGQLFLDIKRLDVPAGRTGVGGDTLGGHIHCNIHDIYLVGDGAVGVATHVGQTIVGVVHDLIRLGTPAPTGTIGLFCGDEGGSINLYISRLIADTAYQLLDSSSVIRLFVGELVGTETPGDGTALVTKAGA